MHNHVDYRQKIITKINRRLILMEAMNLKTVTATVQNYSQKVKPESLA